MVGEPYMYMCIAVFILSQNYLFICLSLLDCVLFDDRNHISPFIISIEPRVGHMVSA